jgi:hypothetical protein
MSLTEQRKIVRQQENLDFKKAVRVHGAAFFLMLGSVITFGILIYQLYTLDKTSETYAEQVSAIPILLLLVVANSLLLISFIVGWAATFYSRNTSIMASFVVILITWLLTLVMSIGFWYLLNEKFILTVGLTI